MNNRVIKACLAAGCSVAGPVLAFSASGFGVKALDSGEGVSSSTKRCALSPICVHDTAHKSSDTRALSRVGKCYQ